jgi:2-aminoadipate transaminase
MASPSPISFARGAPSADIMPIEGLRAAAERALTADPTTALSYGPGYGYPPLREWIAQKHGVDPARVVLFNGSLEAGLMLFDHLVEPGDPVIVEAPSYDRTLLALEARGAELFAVPLEADGIDVGALEVALAAGLEPTFAHIIPNFHNPAGCTMSAAKRERLVELAAEHGFWVFEDDPYRELPFEDPPPPTMMSLDRSGRVIHSSSFSKTVSPGVRVGYLAGPEEEIAKLTKRANEIYISPNMLAESVVWELCRSGALDRNIAFVKEALRERRDALVQALGERLPEAKFVLPGGGYFLWLTLSDDVKCEELLAAALQEQVAFIAGRDFMLEGGRSSMRLSFASVPAAQIDDGVGRIVTALEGLRAASPV